jgi:hypothetical protein
MKHLIVSLTIGACLPEGQQLIVGVANAQKQRGYFGLRLGF